jgi:hypothetical protein
MLAAYAQFVGAMLADWRLKCLAQNRKNPERTC